MQHEHDIYQLALYSGNILVVDAVGPWNLESVQHYHNDVVQVVEAFKGEAWRNIAILRSETLFIPEVAEFLKQHLNWRKTVNVLSDTIILTNSITQHISHVQIQSMFDSVDMTVFFANTLDDAFGDTVPKPTPLI